MMLTTRIHRSSGGGRSLPASSEVAVEPEDWIEGDEESNQKERRRQEMR